MQNGQVEYFFFEFTPHAKPARREPLSKEQAAGIFDAAIRRRMASDGISYVEAFAALQRENPNLVSGYSAVMRRKEK